MSWFKKQIETEKAKNIQFHNQLFAMPIMDSFQRSFEISDQEYKGQMQNYSRVSSLIGDEQHDYELEQQSIINHNSSKNSMTEVTRDSNLKARTLQFSKKHNRKTNVCRKQIRKNSKQLIIYQPANLQKLYKSVDQVRKQSPTNFKAFKTKKASFKKKQISRPVLKDFLFIAKLGVGSYSTVYKAIHLNTGLICALKVVNKNSIKQLGLIENIVRQIKILSFIDHPHIIKIWGYFHDQKNVYIISEICINGELVRKVNQSKSGIISYIQQVSHALHFLHNNGIMHRDIKPENILLNFNHTVKLCDFGWSVYETIKLRKTLCGTPLYLAPQIINQVQYSQSIDIWALGIITYELLSGNLPFKINSIIGLRKIVEDEVCYEQLIQNKQAVSFLKQVLEKDVKKRITIDEVIKHPFFQQRQQFQPDKVLQKQLENF